MSAVAMVMLIVGATGCKSDESAVSAPTSSSSTTAAPEKACGGAGSQPVGLVSRSATPVAVPSGIKIGFFGALTGDASGLILPMRNGAILALEKFNATHVDSKVALVDFDSGGLPNIAFPLAFAAAGDSKIVAMLGPAFSGESEVANPIFNKAGLPAITPSATRSSLSTKGWKIFHRGVADDFAQGPAAGCYIKNVLKAEKVYLVRDDSEYGIGLADGVEKELGRLVVGKDTVRTGNTTFNTLVTKVIGTGATVLFYGGYSAEASPLLTQLRSRGWTGTMVGGDGINDSTMIDRTSTSNVEGTVVTCPCAPSGQAKGSFVANYRGRFSAEPGVYADVTYDLTNVILEGIAAGNFTRAGMLSWINGYNRTNATGITYRWQANGELDPTQVVVWTFKAHNGTWEPDQEIHKSS